MALFSDIYSMHNTVYFRLKSWIELVHMEWGDFNIKYPEEFDELFIIIVNSILEDSSLLEEEIERMTRLIDEAVEDLYEEYHKHDQYEYAYILDEFIKHIEKDYPKDMDGAKL